MRPILLILFILAGCGLNGSSGPSCRPQEVAIIECQHEEWLKNPNKFALEFQRKYCERQFPYDICYAY